MDPLPDFKYSLSSIPDCPAEGCQPVDRVAYRVVFSDIHHANNFIPPLKITPTRKWTTDKVHCELLAISLFTSSESLSAFMHAAEKSVPTLREKLGTHIARGNIAHSDGIADKPNGRGHFNLFEYSTCSLVAKFNIVSALA